MISEERALLRRWSPRLRTVLKVGLAVGLGFGLVVALAFAFDDLCGGNQPDRGIAVLGASACIGGIVGIIVAWRWKSLARAAPWAVAILVTVAAFVGLGVLGVLMWAGECSR